VPSKTATTGGGGLILKVMLVTTTKVIRGIYFNIISHTNSHPQKYKQAQKSTNVNTK